MGKLSFKLIKKDLLLFAALVLAALLVGLLINPFRDKPLPVFYATKGERLDRAVAEISTASPRSATSSLPGSVTLEEFSDFVENRRGIVLDARYRIEHQLSHVPGALSLPREDFAESYAALKPQLESNRSQPIVVYCDGKDCEDSKLVQKALKDLGFTQVAVFEGGWLEWKAAQKPKEAIR